MSRQRWEKLPAPLVQLEAQGNFDALRARVKQKQMREDKLAAAVAFVLVCLPISAWLTPMLREWQATRAETAAQVAAWQQQLQPALSPVIAEGKGWVMVASTVSVRDVERETETATRPSPESVD